MTAKKSETTESPKKAKTGGERSNMMETIAGGWKTFNLKQLDYAQKNADAYFDMVRDALEAKNVPDALAVYNRFAVDTVSRQMEQARELGGMATKAQREVGSRIASFIPGRQK